MTRGEEKVCWRVCDCFAFLFQLFSSIHNFRSKKRNRCCFDKWRDERRAKNWIVISFQLTKPSYSCRPVIINNKSQSVYEFTLSIHTHTFEYFRRKMWLALSINLVYRLNERYNCNVGNERRLTSQSFAMRRQSFSTRFRTHPLDRNIFIENSFRYIFPHYTHIITKRKRSWKIYSLQLRRKERDCTVSYPSESLSQSLSIVSRIKLVLIVSESLLFSSPRASSKRGNKTSHSSSSSSSAESTKKISSLLSLPYYFSPPSILFLGRWNSTPANRDQNRDRWTNGMDE